jgi:hypothetical protein
MYSLREIESHAVEQKRRLVLYCVFQPFFCLKQGIRIVKKDETSLVLLIPLFLLRYVKNRVNNDIYCWLARLGTS